MKAKLLLATALLLAACGADDERTGGATTGRDAAASVPRRLDDAPAAPEFPGQAPVDVFEQALAYGESGNSNLIGYLAMPADVTEPLPGVIVIHESWGLNDDVRALTRRLATEGFVALAVDLYGGATASSAREAQTLVTAVMAAPDAAIANIRQAYDYLDKYALAPSIATLGWSLGGTWSLRAALAMPEEIDAVVVYYGEVVTDPERLRALNMPLLGLFGELDESIPVREVQQFRSRLSELGKSSTVYIYSNVAHAFANPNGGTYDAEAAEGAWGSTIEFLRANL